MSETPKYTGQEVEFGDKKYIMPDLPYAAYEEFDAFEKMTKITVAMVSMEASPLVNPIKKEVFADGRSLLFLAMHRNYPELTEADFKDQINAGTALIALHKLIDREFEIQGIIKQVVEKNVETQTEPKQETVKTLK